ncbi:unnamed protein product [Effrenium voratum]|nr:unnamed protein product [Effrenium voratum]
MSTSVNPPRNLSAEDLEYTWLLLSTVASAYWTTCSKPVLEETPAATCPATGNAGISMRPVAGLKRAREESLAVLPEWLVDVILHLEGLVGRPWSGTPEYCELVLNNWHVPSQALHRSANEESESETFIISRDSIHLVHPISRFLAIPWEEWLRKFQLVLEAEGGRAVSHAHRRLTPAISRRDNATVVAALNEFAGKIESLVEFQTQQFRLKDSRGDHIIATRLRTFVAKGWSDEEVAAWVYTGSSPLLPAMHALLGLRKMDGIYGPLQENWQVLGRQNMPESHRQFLDALEHSVSVRAYCLREWRKAPVELIAALEDSFNNCIETLLRYCNLRQRLANRMFPGAGRVRQLSSWQEKVVRSGRLSLLQMRRVADLHKMRMMKTPLGW